MRAVALFVLLIGIVNPAFALKEKDFKVTHNSVYIYHPDGSGISYFRASWTVPAEPPVDNGQAIAVWIGLEPEDSKSVLQPVVQWGRNWANGGSDGWAVSCWGVNIDRHSEVHSKSTKLTVVRPGDQVTAVIELISRKISAYVYRCYFEGYPNSELIFESPSKLNTAYMEYEMHDQKSCADYSGNVTFFNAQLMSGNQNLSPQWLQAPVEDPKRCGMRIRTSKSGAVSIGVR